MERLGGHRDQQAGHDLRRWAAAALATGRFVTAVSVATATAGAALIAAAAGLAGLGSAVLPLQILVALGALTLLIGMLRLHYQAARFVTRGLGHDGELSTPSLSVASWFIPGANLVLPMISLLAVWQVVASVAPDQNPLRRPPIATWWVLVVLTFGMWGVVEDVGGAASARVAASSLLVLATAATALVARRLATGLNTVTQTTDTFDAQP